VTHPPDSSHAAEQSHRSTEPVPYPKDHVVAVIASHEKVVEAITALSKAGFRASELNVAAGPAAADRLDASTGRTGLLHEIIRFADKLGIQDEEMQAKETYEKALRADEHVITVFTPSEERKTAAADILRDMGATDIAHFGNFIITDLRK
jgi:hypothetical protein